MGHQKSPDFGESELRSVLMLRAWIERVWGGLQGELSDDKRNLENDPSFLPFFHSPPSSFNAT